MYNYYDNLKNGASLLQANVINGILTDWQEDSIAYKGKTYLQMDRQTDERIDIRKDSGTDRIDRLDEQLTNSQMNK
jgi:hypothetical protein